MYRLTEIQANQLRGKEFAPDSFFNPVQDENGNWFISNEEVNQCVNSEFDWVKSLEEGQYTPPVWQP